MSRWIDVQNWESQNDKWRATIAQLYMGKRRQTTQNAENIAVFAHGTNIAIQEYNK
jgi:hypothetical protein